MSRGILSFVLLTIVSFPLHAEEDRLCGAYVASTAEQQAFKDSWKARIAAASPEAAEADIDQTVDLFEQITLGYCQADGEQPVPYYDQGENALDATMRESLVPDFFERITNSVEPPAP